MLPEFHLSDRDFDRVRRLIHRRAGIALGAQKRQMVFSRLMRRLREVGLTDFSAYLDQLEASASASEWQAFTNALTTNLTAFFREEHHFPVLADLARRCPHAPTVWCAAASTGEEPYSIAITLAEALGSRASSARVLATDIDTDVIAQAKAGIFDFERVARLSPERLRRFFLKGAGAHEGKVRVRPEIAAMVSFAPLNLLDASWPVDGPFDAIFCRNVMIYFDKPTQAAILRRFAGLMKPQGLVFAGHSENFSLVDPSFHSRGHTVYELARTS